MCPFFESYHPMMMVMWCLRMAIATTTWPPEDWLASEWRQSQLCRASPSNSSSTSRFREILLLVQLFITPLCCLSL